MRTLLLLFILSLILHADHVRWQGDFEKAREEAIKEKKELMVFLMTPECPECMKMLRSTFMNQNYIADINRDYVAVLVTKDQKQSYPIELLYTLEYPAIFFLDTQEIYTKAALLGYIKPETLEKHLK